MGVQSERHVVAAESLINVISVFKFMLVLISFYSIQHHFSTMLCTKLKICKMAVLWFRQDSTTDFPPLDIESQILLLVTE